jgi:hypothetical protein
MRVHDSPIWAYTSQYGCLCQRQHTAIIRPSQVDVWKINCIGFEHRNQRNEIRLFELIEVTIIHDNVVFPSVGFRQMANVGGSAQGRLAARLHGFVSVSNVELTTVTNAVFSTKPEIGHFKTFKLETPFRDRLAGGSDACRPDFAARVHASPPHKAPTATLAFHPPRDRACPRGPLPVGPCQKCRPFERPSCRRAAR